MTAWLIYEASGALRNREYIQFYIDEGRGRNIDIKLVLADDIDFTVPMPDFAIVRAMLPDLSRKLEDRGVPVFNNSRVSEICNDKAKTYEYLDSCGIPVIPWQTFRGGNAPDAIEFPSVIKPCCGHGGQDVFLVNNEEEYKSALKKILPRDFVIQRVAERLGHDLRVYVIGNEPVASVLRTAKGDFRSNFSLGGDVCAHVLTDEERALVAKVCSIFDFGLCGVDIMYDKGHPVINEIEDVVGSRMLYATHDINIVAMYLDFIQNKLSL